MRPPCVLPVPRLAVWLVVALPVSLAAQEASGKLEGVVRGREGSPLAGVQVIVEGTAFAASTNGRGYYFINNVPPGEIAVRASFIGYRSVEVRGVRMLGGRTVTQDFSLEYSPLRLEEVEVIAAVTPLVPRDEVTTKQRIAGDFIARLPADELSAVLALQPGVVENDLGYLTIRGGRPDEVAVYVDGVPVTPGQRLINNINSGVGWAGIETVPISVGPNAVEQASVITGAWSAGSGNAQSGIISIETRTGGSSYRGSLGYQTDEVFGPNHGLGLNRIDATFGGPIAPRLTFFVSAILEGQHSAPDGMQSERAPLFLSAGVDTTVAVPQVAGDPLSDTTFVGVSSFAVARGRCSDFSSSTNPGIRSNYGLPCYARRIPWSPRSSYELAGKLAYTYGQGSRLSATVLASQNQSRDFDYFGAYNPVQQFGARTWNRVFSLRWTQNLARSAERALALDLAVSYQQDRAVSGPLTVSGEHATRSPLGGFMLAPLDFMFDLGNFPVNDKRVDDFRRGLGASPYDLAAQDQYSLIDQWRNNAYAIAGRIPGGDNGFSESGGPVGPLTMAREDRYLVKGDLDWQVDRYNRLRVGGEFIQHSIGSYWHQLTGQAAADIFTGRPRQLALYAENRLDLGDVVVVGGMRYDWFESDARRPYWFDSTTATYRYIPRIRTNPDYDPADVGKLFRRDPGHATLTPHLQVAFPVTDRTTFRLSYAQQAGIPDFAYMLRRSNGDIGLGGGGLFGADLGFNRTIAFEVGIRHAFSDAMVLDLAVFNRDNVSNATGRQIVLFDPARGTDRKINAMTNADFGNTRGVDIRLDRRLGSLFNGMLGFTLQSARSTGDDPLSYFNRESAAVAAISGFQLVPPQAVLPTRDSRPYSVTAAFSLYLPSDWQQATTLGRLLAGTGLNGIFRFASGEAYTACPGTQANVGYLSTYGTCSSAEPLGDINGSRLPPVKSFDLRLTRALSFAGLDLTLFLDGRNVLNFRNVLTVFSTTGDIHSDADFEVLWAADSSDRANEAQEAGFFQPDGSIDLRFGGLGASGCGAWVIYGRGAAPNCVYLIRAEERFGNGDHIFTAAEQRQSYAAYYRVIRGVHALTGPPRSLRIGFEADF